MSANLGSLDEEENLMFINITELYDQGIVFSETIMIWRLETFYEVILI